MAGKKTQETVEQKEEKLTAKQDMFCLEYLLDLNATQAAIRAGYAPDSAHAEGSRLLANVKVRSRVRELMDARRGQVLVDANFVVDNLIEVSRRCMTAKPVLEWDYEAGMYKETGEYEFDSSGANKSLELIGKHLGMFSDKLDVTTKGESLNAPDLSKLSNAEKLEYLKMLKKMRG